MRRMLVTKLQGAGLLLLLSVSMTFGGRNWLYYPSSDVLSTSETIFPQTNVTDIPSLQALCDATPTCIGFNSHGWLKNGSSSIASNPVDLYIASSSPSPDIPLVWPRPTSIVTGKTPLVVTPALVFEATTPSNDLTAAFARIAALIFANGAGSAPSAAATPHAIMQTLIVTVENVYTPLQLGVNESYTLTLPADGTAGLLTAATVYGAYAGVPTAVAQLLFCTRNDSRLMPCHLLHHFCPPLPSLLVFTCHFCT
jgi:hypothetical protein